MAFSVEFGFRLVGAIVGGVVLGYVGSRWRLGLAFDPLAVAALLTLVGVLAGLVLTPFFTTRPARLIRQSLIAMPPERLVAMIAGIFLGLAAAVLLSFPLSFLPAPFRQITPLVAALVFCYFSVVILMWRQNDLRSFFGGFRPIFGAPAAAPPQEAAENVILLDTSVIIDGRIADISKTGFVRLPLVVPQFVLHELQHVADSSDPLRRNRGRRGLDVLNVLQKESRVPVRISDMDAPEAHDTDSKLVALARKWRCPIMTNDYNLNRVAELQGVTVLNINDLATAVRVNFLPGENLSIKIIQEGREYGQGIGYLDDGTMVVVEDGRGYLNDTIHVTVTKVLQTTAGRMIFART